MKRLPLSIAIISVVILILFAPVLLSPARGVGNFGDIYLHYYPLKHLVTEYLINGRMPLWNPYIFAGQPLMANPQSAVAYPFSLIFSFFPLSVGFTIFFVLHLILGGSGMYLLLAERRLCSSACFVGAVSYACSSLLVSKAAAGHPVLLSGYVWLPFVVLGVVRVGAPARMSFSPEAILLVLAAAFQFLSGHTFPVYISLAVTLILCARYKVAHARQLALLAGAVAAVCAFQLFQTLELSRAAETGNWPHLARQYSLSPRDLVALVMPRYFGSIIDGTYIHPANPSFFFEKHAFYFGLVTFLLAIAGLVDSVRRRAFMLPALAAAGVFLALGFSTPLYRWMYGVIPGMDLLRVPARFLYIAVFALIMLAALGWDRWFRRAPLLLKAGLVVLIMADLVAVNASYVFPGAFDRYVNKNNTLADAPPFQRIITDESTIAANKAMLYHHHNLNGYEAIFLQDFVRYLGLQEKGLFSATGLARTDIASPIGRGFAAGSVVTTGKEGVVGTAVSDALPRVYFPAYLKNGSAMDVYEQMAWLADSHAPPHETLLLPFVPASVPLITPPAAVLSYRFEPDRVMVRARCDGPAVLALSDVMYPGWQAAAGGRALPVMRGHKVFRTVICPQGEYDGVNAIIIYFHPVVWRFGLLITLAGLLAAGGYLLYVLRQAAGARA